MDLFKIPKYIYKAIDKTNKNFLDKIKEGDGVSAVIPTIAGDKIFRTELEWCLSRKIEYLNAAFLASSDEHIYHNRTIFGSN